jgi:hypothetical protein
MRRETPLQALATFFRDIRKSSGNFQMCMLLGIGGCIAAGYYFAQALGKVAVLGPTGGGAAVLMECLVLWLLAFVLGVRARPGEQRVYCEYPPGAVFRGTWGKGIVACLATGSVAGWVRAESVLMSLLWALIGFAATELIVLWAFIGSIPGTKAGVARKGDPSVMIADAYQRTWSFHGVAVLAVLGLACWLFGLPVNSWFSGGVLHSSLVIAVFATGYASGYYP